jgi:hypothetical protein
VGADRISGGLGKPAWGHSPVVGGHSIGELACGGFTHRTPPPSLVVGIGRHVYAVSTIRGRSWWPDVGFRPARMEGRGDARVAMVSG